MNTATQLLEQCRDLLTIGSSIHTDIEAYLAKQQVEQKIISESLLGAIARGWCHDKNRRKEMDGDLVASIAEEVLALYAPIITRAITALRYHTAQTRPIQSTDMAVEYLESILQTPKQVEQEPVAWLVTTELQDGTRSTYPLTGRYKDVCDSCDFGNPTPLYLSRY
jgi:hypothetical protein